MIRTEKGNFKNLVRIAAAIIIVTAGIGFQGCTNNAEPTPKVTVVAAPEVKKTNVIPYLDKKENSTYYWQKSNEESEAIRAEIIAGASPTRQAELEVKVTKIEKEIDNKKILVIEAGDKLIKIYGTEDYYEVNGKKIKTSGKASFVDGENLQVPDEVIVVLDLLNL